MAWTKQELKERDLKEIEDQKKEIEELRQKISDMDFYRCRLIEKWVNLRNTLIENELTLKGLKF